MSLLQVIYKWMISQKALLSPDTFLLKVWPSENELLKYVNAGGWQKKFANHCSLISLNIVDRTISVTLRLIDTHVNHILL